MRFVTAFVVLWCICFTPCVASLDWCQTTYGEEVVLHTSYKSGEHACCKSIGCPEGFEAVLCSPTDPSTTDCRPCPANTFQPYPTNSVDMIYCEAKQTCAEGMKAEDDDSSTKDRRCLCDLEKGLCNPSRNRSTYCLRRNCLVGMELNQNCSCTECMDGFFKDGNGSMPCQPWRNCRDEGLEIVVHGTTTTDAVCSNSTFNDWRGASTTVHTSTSTTLPENVFTSDLSVHSMESRQNSSDLTTLSNETPQSWILAAAIIIVSIVVTVGFVAVVIVVFVCCKPQIAKRICAGCISDQPPPAQPEDEFEAFLPNKEGILPGTVACQHVETQNERCVPEQVVYQRVEAQNERVLRGQIVDQSLTQGDPAQDPQTQQESYGVEDDPYSNMTRAMKESLQNCRVTLLNSIITNADFLAVLNVNNTITNDMREIIQSERTQSKKNDKLLDYLPKRPRLSYKTFIFALVFTRQSHLARQINADLAEEYKAYVESGGSAEDKVLSFGRL